MATPPPLLRDAESPSRARKGIVLAALVGAAAASLVALGNPGNMGICGACFLRDLGGALGLHGGPAIFRPELAGVLLGAFALGLVRGSFAGRSGGHAVARFLFGAWMGIGALVFLGCPFRLLQRLGGGDGSALAGAAGLLAGVGAALPFERRGFTPGRTSPAPLPVGLLGPVVALALLGLFLGGGLPRGPGPGDPADPKHAPWAAALGIGLAAGAALSATGFCAISACRQVFSPGKTMLVATGALIAAYAAVLAVTGKLKPGFTGQPAAHGDALASFLAMALVGLAGAFAGGCPVRQVVMAGEGNGDAFVAVVGIAFGASLGHGMGLVSSPAGATAAGRIAVAVGIAFCVLYAIAFVRTAPKPA
jgi:YedE family putative selenium metabolism protein